jgi:hypothetical protein
MAVQLNEQEYYKLFRTARKSIRRMESRGNYDAEHERVEREAFLAGERPYERPVRFSTWDQAVRAQRARGVTFEKVRVMDDPLTPNNRFRIWSNSQAARNDEVIRYLTRSRAIELDLPDHDFWVFDSEQLLLMPYTGDDRLMQTLLVTDPALVALHDGWLDLAWANATPYKDYLAEDPTRAEPPIRLPRDVPTVGQAERSA